MKQTKRLVGIWIVTVTLLMGVLYLAMNLGSLKVTPTELIKGLFVEYNPTVATIYDLRFPRIFVAVLGGGAVSVAGVLFQAVLKNPLADPSMIGISSGASLAAFLVAAFAPNLASYVPLAAFLGGLFACMLVYTLAWKKGACPLRILLVGIAISSVFSGMIEALETIVSGNVSIVSSNMTMKTWGDVKTLCVMVIIGMIAALLLSNVCNLFALEDNTAKSLGIPMNQLRLLVCITAVLLVSISTAIFGVIAFLGLIVPHMARALVGSNHKRLTPFAFVLGSLVLLIADTAGRVLFAPFEIPATIIMAVIGGPFFVLLIRRSNIV